MKLTVTATARFSASHMVPGDAWCGRPHGHSWVVAVTCEGGLNPKTGSVVDHADLLGAISALAHEVDREDLNAMAPSIVTTPEGVALYLREQLILHFPGLTTVRVDMDDLSASVEIERR